MAKERIKRGTYSNTSASQKEILIKLIYAEGKKIKDAAKILGINVNTAKSIILAYRRDGEIKVNTRGGNNRLKLSNDILMKVENIVEVNPTFTLKQIKENLAADEVFLSISSIFGALEKLAITLKKCHTELDRVNSELTILSRQQYASNFIANAPGNMAKCIFIDECGFNLHLHRSQARSKKGTRAKVILPTIRGRNVTMIGAICANGVLHKKIINDGTCNATKFCGFIRELVEILKGKEDMNGAWLIMDNARIHKTDELKVIIEESTFNLEFLSPYSYMLNPIENVFSKVKAYVRSQINISTEVSLVDLIEQGMDTISQNDCGGYVMKMTRNLSIAVSGQPMPID